MIGFFDSGIGGLTVVREFKRRAPQVPLLYFGDTARTPYGNKSPEVVAEYGLEATRFLVEHGATAVVVACNTVSAVGLASIRHAYPELPVFDVITPAVQAVKALEKIHRVGIMGTRALVGSGVYQQMLKGYKVFAFPAPLLVPLVEEGWLDAPETKRIVKHYLMPFKQVQVEALVLACTHYPLLKTLIQARIPKRTKLIDPAAATTQAVAAWCEQNQDKLEAAKQSRYFVTDVTPHTQDIACRFLGRDITLEHAVVH